MTRTDPIKRLARQLQRETGDPYSVCLRKARAVTELQVRELEAAETVASMAVFTELVTLPISSQEMFDRVTTAWKEATEPPAPQS